PGFGVDEVDDALVGGVRLSGLGDLILQRGGAGVPIGDDGLAALEHAFEDEAGVGLVGDGGVGAAVGVLGLAVGEAHLEGGEVGVVGGVAGGELVDGDA